MGDFTSLTLLAVERAPGRDVRGAGAAASRSGSGTTSTTGWSAACGCCASWRACAAAPAPPMPVVFTSTLNQADEARADGEEQEPPAEAGRAVYSISQTPQVWLDHQVFEEPRRADLQLGRGRGAVPRRACWTTCSRPTRRCSRAWPTARRPGGSRPRPAPGQPAPPARRVQRHRGAGAGGAPPRAVPGAGRAAAGRRGGDHLVAAAHLRRARPRRARPRPPAAAARACGRTSWWGW